MIADRLRSPFRPRPTVLFADDQGWSSFDQVAAALRRRGVRAVRVVTSEPPGLADVFSEPHLRWLADRSFYDEVIVLSRPGAERRLGRLLDRGVADVVATEPTLLRIGLDSETGRRLVARALAFSGAPPPVLLNKFTVNQRLAEHGVAVPSQVRADALTPAQAIRRLGLPLVIKDPIGAGGDQVRIADSLEEVQRALDGLGGDCSRLFYQEHIQGRMVIYASIWGADGPLMEHGVAIGQSQYNLGPASTIRIYDEPALLEAGRKAAELFGCRGFTSFGFMQAADGRLFHVDANIRIWGMILAPLSVGIDFIAPYAALVSGRRWTPSAPAQLSDDEIPVFPYRLLQAIRSGSPAEMTGAWGDFLRSSWRPVGPSYCLHVGLRAALVGVGRLRREWRQRAPGSRGPAADTAKAV